MDTGVCACCGNPNGDGLSMTLPVYIMSRFRGEPDHRRSIMLCGHCKTGMPLDLTALIEHVDKMPTTQIADEAILEGFVTRYLNDVWPEDQPPSFATLCKVLNAVGIRAARGGKWEYHNLQQKLTCMDIDRDAILAERAKSSYTERIANLVERSAAYTATMRNLTTPTTEIKREWGPPDVELPADMPGQLQEDKIGV